MTWIAGERPSELFSDSNSFDDHRDANIDHLDDEFAATVAAELARLAASVDRVIICASPRMLGRLRELTKDLQRPGLVIDELPRDLVKLTAPQIRDQLASYGFLPLRRPTFEGRP